MKKYTIEQVDKHLESFKPKATATSSKLCTAYTKVRPIIGFAVGLVSFFRPKWVTEINVFISAMDKECKITTP